MGAEALVRPLTRSCHDAPVAVTVGEEGTTAGGDAAPTVLLLGDATARPVGLERAMVRGGLHPVEQDRTLAGGGPTAPDALLVSVAAADAALDGAVAAAVSRWGRSTPLLVIVADADDAGAARALELGAVDAVRGPIHLPELLARLHLRIAESRRRASNARVLADGSVFDLVQEVIDSVRSEEVLHALVQRLTRALDLAHCSFVLVAPGAPFGRVVADSSRTSTRDVRLELERYPEIREAIRSGRPVVVPNVHQHPLFEPLRALWAEAGLDVQVHSVVALPVTVHGEVGGVFLLRTRDPAVELTPSQVAFADSLARAAARVLARNGDGAMNGGAPAALDPLTGLATSDTLGRRVQEEFERARRYALGFSFVLVDIESLRVINERFGVDTGDRTLAELSELLRRELRAPDTVSRYGGDEFALVLPETSADGARALLQRVWRRVASAPIAGLPDDQPLRLSAGIASMPHPAAQASDDLFALAEAALLRGKSQALERIGSADTVGL